MGQKLGRPKKKTMEGKKIRRDGPRGAAAHVGNDEKKT